MQKQNQNQKTKVKTKIKVFMNAACSTVPIQLIQLFYASLPGQALHHTSTATRGQGQTSASDRQTKREPQKAAEMQKNIQSVIYFIDKR